MAGRAVPAAMVRSPRTQARVAGWVTLVLAVLIFAVPLFVGAEAAWHHWSNYTAGVILAFLSVLTIASPHRRSQGALAAGMIEVAIGIWVVATAFAAPSNGTYLVANLVLGLALVAVSLWSLTIGMAVVRRSG